MGLNASGADVVTTTYGYDYSGQRVLQTGTSTTTIYPNRWFSVSSSTLANARYSTTTEYIYSGDSLVATVDQQIAFGAATGTAQTRYIHPDHLGSTNVVTNASGTVVQTLDYYPFGATRISSGSNASARKYIGQFSDDSNLLYLQARYDDPQRGQFLSQDPVFLALGNPNQIQQLIQQDQQKFLSDPQQMNSYNYARNNPIVNKDPNGHGVLGELGLLGIHMTEARGAPYTYFGYYYGTFGNPNISVSQQIGGAIDLMTPVALIAVQKLNPIGGIYGMWEAFVLSGELITGRDPSESAQYVEELKGRVANEWKIPGYKFAPSPKPSSGSSGGPMPGTSGSSGGNGQPQPQKTPSGSYSSGGSSQSYYQQQIASIQAQIASIQAQINAYVQKK